MTRFDLLLVALARASVDFIVIGGAAGVAHGSTRFTNDLDIVYGRAPDNVDRLVHAIEPFHPYLRGAAPGLPFRWDRATILAGLNFTLTTDIGDLDALGEVTGGGRYEDLLPHTVAKEAFGVRCLFVTLSKLIQLKRAAGRPRDLDAIAELQALLEETGGAD